MPRREVGEDLPRAEHRRLQCLRQAHRLRLRTLPPHVVPEDQHRAARLAEPARQRLDRLRAGGRRALDLVLRGLADLRLEPLAVEQLRADREIDRPRRSRGRLAQRARGGDGDGGRVRPHLVRAARLLHERAHGFGLAQPGKGREAAIVLDLGHPVPGDDQQRGAGDLGVEELAGELVGAAHHVGDDDADLAAHAVVAVGHRRHQSLVLAHHEPLIAVLGERREDPGLRGAGVREQILDARVLQRLEEQHPARSRDGLAHGSPRCHR